MIVLAMAPAVQTIAQVAVERVLNSLPEGMLLAGCAWLLLRLLGRQNAGTRFAVWLVTLVGVAGLPLLSAFEVAGHRLSAAPHAGITVPAFWAVLFAGFWILIAMIALARLVAGILQVRTIRKSCAELAIEQLDVSLRDVFPAAGERRVRLLISESARVPAAIGFRNPAIVLPAWTLQELPADELKPILIHEMAASGLTQAGEAAQASAERVWSEVKRQAQQVGHEIEERPFTSALAAFSTGLILGMLVNSRRG